MSPPSVAYFPRAPPPATSLLPKQQPSPHRFSSVERLPLILQPSFFFITQRLISRLETLSHAGTRDKRVLADEFPVEKAEVRHMTTSPRSGTDVRSLSSCRYVSRSTNRRIQDLFPLLPLGALSLAGDARGHLLSLFPVFRIHFTDALVVKAGGTSTQMCL